MNTAESKLNVEKSFKVIYLVKRKAGMSREEFMERYLEHAPLVLKYLGQTLATYTLNFPYDADGGIGEFSAGGDYIPKKTASEYDCITEMTWPNRVAFDEGAKIYAQPEVAKIIDESGFIEYKSVLTLYCSEAIVKR
jgi:hypothetical protein